MRRSQEKKSQPWWRFTGDGEVFEARNPDQISRLYFPLCNEAGMLSAITPTLHGDIKTSQNTFLTAPVTAEDLHLSRTNRNFWIKFVDGPAWSVAGTSATQEAEGLGKETTRVDAGVLWHRLT